MHVRLSLGQSRDDKTPHVWLSKWAPWPAAIPRGPYARPTRSILREIEDGVRRVADHD